jgi:hypothetical protein
VQLLVQHAPALHAPSPHVVLRESYTQFCESFVHVASVVVLAQVFPAALQTGSLLHVHAAVPAVPVQLWCVPHVEVDDSYTQSCASFAHVTRVVVFEHVVPALLQPVLVLHVQAAMPAAPVQPWCAPQATGVP